MIIIVSEGNHSNGWNELYQVECYYNSLIYYFQ